MLGLGRQCGEGKWLGPEGLPAASVTASSPCPDQLLSSQSLSFPLWGRRVGLGATSLLYLSAGER